MNYVLYFDGYDNNTYFYKSIGELLKHWDCETLVQFKEEHKRKYFCILKIEKVILESQV